jgi:hypothetical protein
VLALISLRKCSIKGLPFNLLEFYCSINNCPTTTTTMPPKKDAGTKGSGGAASKSSSGDKGDKKSKAGDNEDVQRDQKLQAILLADSFTKTFRPVTWWVTCNRLHMIIVPCVQDG